MENKEIEKSCANCKYHCPISGEYSYREYSGFCNHKKHMGMLVTEKTKHNIKCCEYKPIDCNIKETELNENIHSKLDGMLKDYKRCIEEDILFNILCKFYFADWTRKRDYDKMTSEEVVNAVMQVCKDIEEKYNYKFEDDILGSVF